MGPVVDGVSAAEVTNATNANSYSSNSNDWNNNPKRLTTILGSALEVIVHQLLYSRKLYPKDAFAPARYLGVQCYACRDPGVVNYIYNTLAVAVPAICTGNVTELSLVFYDDDQTLERFVWKFSLKNEEIQLLDSSNNSYNNQPDTIHHDETSNYSSSKAHHHLDNSVHHTINKEDRTMILNRIRDLERAMRDILLRIISFGSSGSRKRHIEFSDNATFKLCVRTSPNNNSLCLEIQKALHEGKWNRSDENNDNGNVTVPKTRTLKCVHSPMCGLKVEMYMNATPFD